MGIFRVEGACLWECFAISSYSNAPETLLGSASFWPRLIWSFAVTLTLLSLDRQWFSRHIVAFFVALALLASTITLWFGVSSIPALIAIAAAVLFVGMLVHIRESFKQGLSGQDFVRPNNPF